MARRLHSRSSTARVADPASTDAAREQALRLLERRRRTRSDLAERLSGRGFESECVTRVLDRLTDVGLVDDQAFAEAFLRDRLAFRPRSRRVLSLELRRKGVAEKDIEAAFEVLGEEIDEPALAARLLDKRLSRLQRLPEEERKPRAQALLRRYGFAWHVVQETVEQAELLGERPVE